MHRFHIAVFTLLLAQRKQHIVLARKHALRYQMRFSNQLPGGWPSFNPRIPDRCPTSRFSKGGPPALLDRFQFRL
jgi:hypothetical protein